MYYFNRSYTPTHTHTHIHNHTHIHTYAHTHTYIHLHTHITTPTHTYTHTHLHTQTPTHTHSMVSALMKSKQIHAVLVGADRVAANGDTANKIGTYQLAIAAKYHDIPFFVVAPVTSVSV